MEDTLKIKLDFINNQIEIYKKNAIKEIQKEEMIPATSSLLILRDLKEQQLLIKDILNILNKED